jgi:hypothetical protein
MKDVDGQLAKHPSPKAKSQAEKIENALDDYLGGSKKDVLKQQGEMETLHARYWDAKVEIEKLETRVDALVGKRDIDETLRLFLSLVDLPLAITESVAAKTGNLAAEMASNLAPWVASSPTTRSATRPSTRPSAIPDLRWRAGAVSSRSLCVRQTHPAYREQDMGEKLMKATRRPRAGDDERGDVAKGSSARAVRLSLPARQSLSPGPAQHDAQPGMQRHGRPQQQAVRVLDRAEICEIESDQRVVDQHRESRPKA